MVIGYIWTPRNIVGDSITMPEIVSDILHGGLTGAES